MALNNSRAILWRQTFIYGHIHPAQTLLLESIHVSGEGVAGLLPRLDESLVKRMVGLSSGHMKRSTSSAVSTGKKTYSWHRQDEWQKQLQSDVDGHLSSPSS